MADSYNNLGAIAATNSEYSRAVTYFERAAVWNPSLEGLDYNWGRAAFAGRQFADAVMPLSRYLKSHPDDTGGRSVLAMSQFMTGNYHSCMETLQPVIGKGDLIPEVEYAYAQSMIKTGQIGLVMDLLGALEKPGIPEIPMCIAHWRSVGPPRRTMNWRFAGRVSHGDSAQFNRMPAHITISARQLEGGNTQRRHLRNLVVAVRLSPDSEEFHQELANAYLQRLFAGGCT